MNPAHETARASLQHAASSHHPQSDGNQKDEEKESKRKVPQRHFQDLSGNKNVNPRIPTSVPIIGFGGSAISQFFISSDVHTDPRIQQFHHAGHRNHPKIQEWIHLLKYAILDRGITLIDTAAWYGHGLSETVIGYVMEDILDDLILPRSNLIINTKIGRYEEEPLQQFDYSYEKTISAVKLSVERMKCTYIDVLQLHDPEFSPSIDLLLDETIPAMLHIRDHLQLCRALGLTGYPLRIQHEILVRSSQLFGCTLDHHISSMIFDVSLTYCHFNLHDSSLFLPMISLDQSDVKELHMTACGIDMEELKSTSDSFAEFCWRNSIGLMAAAPFSMGLLTPKGPPSWHPASMKLKEACKKAVSLCHEFGIDISTLALIYALSRQEIACTIVGMGSIQEVDNACTVATRFHPIENQSHHGCKSLHSLDLSRVCTPDELMVLNLLLERENGPFASVWRTGDSCWDGVAIAQQFWDKCPYGILEAESRMRRRSRHEEEDGQI